MEWRHGSSVVCAVTALTCAATLWIAQPLQLVEDGAYGLLPIYVLAVLVLGAPLVMAELALGRRGRGAAIDAIRATVVVRGASPLWTGVGALALLIATLLAVRLLLEAAELPFSWARTLRLLSRDDLALPSPATTMNTRRLAAGSLALLLATTGVLMLGLRRGLERLLRWVLPTLVVLLLCLAATAAAPWMFDGRFAERTLEAMHSLTLLPADAFAPATVLRLLRVALLSVAVGTGVAVVIGAYLSADHEFGRRTFRASVFGLASAAVLTLVLVSHGSGTGTGTGTVQSGDLSLAQLLPKLPLDADRRALGEHLLLLSVLLGLILLTLTMLGESLVNALEQALSIDRQAAVLLVFVMLWACSSLAALGFGPTPALTLADRPLGYWIRWLPVTVLLPLSALLFAMLCGWRWHRDGLQRELRLGSSLRVRAVLLLLRIVVPIVALLVLVLPLF